VKNFLKGMWHSWLGYLKWAVWAMGISVVVFAIVGYILRPR
jgi:hypothetical protein